MARLSSTKPASQSGARRAFAQLYVRARENFLQTLSYFGPSLGIIGLVGAVLFPTYYVIWAYIFPQPYENLPMRLVGAVLCLAASQSQRWPEALHKFIPPFWYLTCLYSLPFFFTYMLLKNDGSDVALMTFIVITFLLILVVDWLNLIILFVAGAALGWLYFVVTEGVLAPPDFELETVPIILFAVIFGSIVSYKADLVKRERMNAMLSVSATIAHEMRTPLLAIRAGANTLRRSVPKLIDVHTEASDAGLKTAQIRPRHLSELPAALERIDTEVNHANVIIDMLLNNAGRAQIRPENLEPCSMADCVDDALERFVFKTRGEQSLVNWDRHSDFSFRGSKILMVHVLFNLLKNALYFVQNRHDDKERKIEIFCRNTEYGNLLIFRDNGIGIPAERLPYIFEPFYSSLEHGTGTGMGLSFCKMVIEGFGGDISCRSEEGRYTEFTLRFPII